MLSVQLVTRRRPGGDFIIARRWTDSLQRFSCSMVSLSLPLFLVQLGLSLMEQAALCMASKNELEMHVCHQYVLGSSYSSSAASCTYPSLRSSRYWSAQLLTWGLSMLRRCLIQLSLSAPVFFLAVFVAADTAAVLDGGGIPCPASTGATPALCVSFQSAGSTPQTRRRKRFGPGNPGWGESWWLFELLKKTAFPLMGLT